MKKKIACYLFISLILSGCANGKVVGNINKTEENKSVEISDTKSDTKKEEKQLVELSEAEQLKLFLDKQEEWEVVDSTIEGSFGEQICIEDHAYAISDLDDDGFLEIIVTGWAGTGHFSTTLIYEYDGKDDLKMWDTSAWSDDYSEPDILLQNEIAGISGTEQEIIQSFVKDNESRQYLFTDKEYYSTGGGVIYYFKTEFVEDAVSSQFIGYQQVSGDDETIYYNSDYEEVSKENFDSLISDIFAGYEEKQLTLKWFTEITQENIEKSYN